MEIMIGCTHVPIDRPNDNQTRKAHCTEKKKGFTINTTMIMNRKGLIIVKGRSVTGLTHDLATFCDDDFDLGLLTKLAMDPKTPDEQRITARLDLDCDGIAMDLPCAITKINHKRSKYHELTKREKDNRCLYKKRVRVEHTMVIN